jgi:Na+/phosphate symporter
MIVLLPLLVAIVGALVYLLVKQNAEAKELGRLAFAVGLLVFLMQGAGEVVSLLNG